MEKGTSRIIGYDKKAHAAIRDVPKKDTKRSEITKEPSKSAKVSDNQSFTIIQWLKSHDLIKIRALCEKSGIDPGNFHRWVNVKKEIPKEVQDKIIPIIKKYGYAL